MRKLNVKLLEKGEPFRLFGAFLGSLGAVGSLLGNFLEPLGQLGHQKSPKGVPKAPKGLPKVTKKIVFLKHLWITEISKKYTKMYTEKHLKNTYKSFPKCLQSVAPAMLLALSDNIESKSEHNLHNSYGHACHAFEPFLLSKDLKNIEKTLEKKSRNGAQRRCSETLKVWQALCFRDIWRKWETSNKNICKKLRRGHRTHTLSSNLCTPSSQTLLPFC